MSRCARCPLVLAAMLCVAGCAAEAPPSAATSRTLVEEGVTIVESVAPVQGADAWVLSAEPLVTIGVNEGSEQDMLGNVHGLGFLPDGSIAIADSSNELRIFDSNGAHLRTVGRSGEGPCEFQAIAQPWFAADGTVAVTDWRARRASVIGPEGECLATVPLQVADHAGADVFARFGNGDLVLGAWNFTPPDPSADEEISWRELTLLRRPWRSEAEPVALGVTRWMETAGGRLESLQFGSQASFDAVGDRLFVSDGERYEIEVRGLDGETLLRMRRAELPPAVTDVDIERFEERSRRNITAHAPDPEQALTRLARNAYAERFPGYRHLTAAADGSVWARPHLGLPDTLPSVYTADSRAEQMFPAPESVDWDVYDPAGRWLAVARIPSGRYVADVREDRVLMSDQDAAGVNRVRVYEVIRGAADR